MTNKEIHTKIKHLRQAARASCDSYIGRMTRQTLNHQADELENQLKPVCTPIDFLNPADRMRIEVHQKNK